LIQVGAGSAIPRDELLGVQPLTPHDQRVLVVVAVIAAADPFIAKAIFLIERLSRLVGYPHFQRRAARADLHRDLQQRREEKLAEPLAPQVALDPNRGDVRFFHHQPHPGEPHQPLV